MEFKEIYKKLNILKVNIRYKLFIFRTYIEFFILYLYTCWNNIDYFKYYDPNYQMWVKVTPTYKNYMSYVRNFNRYIYK